MRVVFTRSSSLMSRVIRWVTGEPVSHTAIEFSDGVYAHSNLLGVQFAAQEQFEHDSEIVSFLYVPAGGIAERQLRNICHAHQGDSYDFLGLLWIALVLLVRKYTGLTVPGPNRWANRRAFICTEFVSDVILGAQDSLITPGQLFLKLQALYNGDSK